MLLEQAVYTSAKTKLREGYHIVAKSTGVSNEVTTALNRSCPSHDSLQCLDANFQSLNFHDLGNGMFSISRSVYGGKEFSNRGGLQVATIVLLARREQLAGYDYNVIRLARAAQSLGHLRWTPRFPSQLPRVEIPDAGANIHGERLEHAVRERDQLLAHWRSGKTVVVVTDTSADELMESCVLALSAEERLLLSFTTGLKWTKQRPFQLYVLRNLRTDTRLRLQSAGAVILGDSDRSALQTSW